MTAKSLAVLLRDASKLIRPPLVTAIPDTIIDHPQEERSDRGNTDNRQNNRHISDNVLPALNDLTTLFKSWDTHTPKETHVSHKLTFYAARLMSTPSAVLHLLANELAARAELVERQGVDTGAKPASSRSQLMIDDDEPLRKTMPQDAVPPAYIEELA